jgi:hypothetical protein
MLDYHEFLMVSIFVGVWMVQLCEPAEGLFDILGAVDSCHPQDLIGVLACEEVLVMFGREVP